MSSRDRRTCDIAPGSTWNARAGDGCAIVIRIVGAYVEFEDEAGRLHMGPGAMYHAHFRERYVEPYDAQQCRSQFSMSLANLANFHAFWSPSQRRMYARSATGDPAEVRGAARGRPALPADAEYIGTYAVDEREDGTQPRRMGPCEAFLEDLNDLLASIGRTPAI